MKRDAVHRASGTTRPMGRIFSPVVERVQPIGIKIGRKSSSRRRVEPPHRKLLPVSKTDFLSPSGQATGRQSRLTRDQ